MSSFTRRFVVVAAIAFSHVCSISNRGVSRTSARYHLVSSSKTYSTSRARYYPLRSRRPDDFIEAEIVSQTDRNPENSKRDPNQKIEILGMDKESAQGKKEESGGIFNKLASFFGQDEESKQKRERKKQMNSAIDKIFEGSGALGTVFGSLAKGIGGLVQESMYAASADFEVIQASVLNKIEADADCVSALGGKIILSQPFTSSSSSSNINGVTKKDYFYVMSASGNSGQGQLQVRASMDSSNKVSISELVLQTNTGKVINVISGRGGGGRGGGGGRVIDVEANVQ